MQFFNTITKPDWLENMAQIYRDDLVFSHNLDGLFDSLQIPNQNVVADGSPLPANLALRLAELRLRGFAVVQQNRHASGFLLAVRLYSQVEGYYVYTPASFRMPPKTVSPDCPEAGGQNHDGADGVGGAGGSVAAV
jgi:hypothetical protein